MIVGLEIILARLELVVIRGVELAYALCLRGPGPGPEESEGDGPFESVILDCDYSNFWGSWYRVVLLTAQPEAQSLGEYYVAEVRVSSASEEGYGVRMKEGI